MIFTMPTSLCTFICPRTFQCACAILSVNVAQRQFLINYFERNIKIVQSFIKLFSTHHIAIAIVLIRYRVLQNYFIALLNKFKFFGILKLKSIFVIAVCFPTRYFVCRLRRGFRWFDYFVGLSPIVNKPGFHPEKRITQDQNNYHAKYYKYKFSIHMIKKFSSPKIKIWFEPMFFSGFFCGFQRCVSAAFPNFRGGNSSPPQAAKCVRTNSRILHHVGNCKFEGFASLCSATNLYSILGVKTNSRFRILGEENFLILNTIKI